MLRQFPTGLPKTRIHIKISLNYRKAEQSFNILEKQGFVTITEQGTMHGLRTNVKITDKGIDILKQLNPSTINALINLGARLTGFQNP